MTHADQSSAQRLFIESVMQRTGWTQTELALKAGLDPSTISRFLNGGGDGRALRASTIRKIEMASGLQSDGDRGQDRPAAGFAEAEAEPILRNESSPLEAIISALSQGRINVDAWTLQSRALETAGYRPGDILLVALGETPLAGDVVCAQLYDWPKSRAETVFRIFQPPYLVAASPDPALMRPHVVDDGAVQIKGVVIHTIRSRPQA